jgi:hypothetical protein
MNNGWIGVDLDGTLFHYEKWVGWNVFGEPIQPMVDRVRQWLNEGKEVRIVTARVGLPTHVSGGRNYYRVSAEKSCRVTKMKFSDSMMVAAIQKHLVKHDLPALPVQCYKDVNMIEFWDDRAVQVVPNTGRTLAEEHEARYNAQRGKVFEG